MLIIREVKGHNHFDEEPSSTYYIMDVSWFKEKLWIVEKYEGYDSFGNRKLVYKQLSWQGIKGIIEGLKIQEQTFKDVIDEVERDKDDLLILRGRRRFDYSHYETVRWFPFIRGIWTRNKVFIRDFKGHNMTEDYPEYFI